MNLITSVGAGIVAGAVGTAAMDLLWYRRYRRRGGRERFSSWESAAGVRTWDAASAPGQVGRKVAELVSGSTPPDSWARPTTNVVHWATGIGWGITHGVAQAVSSRPRAVAAALGPTAWLASYAILPVLGVYRPIWKYDARTLGKDLSAHLVFGLATAAAHAILTKAGRRR
ncbi:hypothetical protein FLP10_00555 [Agromyces intestinalis]|uniref:DUF1440 domain-containing protein n=1 Tax=Agromyces intestinalis TaxID=2592652 RepID=A0A5C1YE52_9MICO|nr:hypothetical protein [Agromyces intestinalis]QEO13072.1 hypothetical protein FLP10_00555 [Agromyces intestinalis]